MPSLLTLGSKPGILTKTHVVSLVSRLTCSQLSAFYGSHTVFNHLSLSAEAGDLISVLGSNGGGKSTFLRLLAGLHTQYAGEIRWEHPSDQRCAYAPQKHAFPKTFPLSVYEAVATGLWRPGAWHFSFKSHQKRIQEALAQVGLLDKCDAPLETLSGGQIQKILLARILLNDRPIILLDEPFDGLDYVALEFYLKKIHHWQSQGKTIFIVLHDLTLVSQYFPKSLFISRSHCFFGPTHAVLKTYRKSMDPCCPAD